MAIIKATNKIIRDYYASLEAYRQQDIYHETAVRSAFQNLLADIAGKRKWILIPELGGKISGKRIIPDGTVRDSFYLPRGYWEAKDADDDLDAEIRKKIAKGYPLTNIIFEDTREAVLYQSRQVVMRIELSDPQKLADLLNQFFDFQEPSIDSFEKAIEEFKERVPDLAKGLVEKIAEAHKNNKKFIKAFSDFFSLCQTSLNPDISIAAVDEMLVQHLLTERLFRTVLDNREFTSRNVIAVEVEKVIAALVSKNFNRKEFLQSLERFYKVIESASIGLTEFSEKQHFLDMVYERFFQGYSIKVADTHGIVYTPQPIVDFMCASVEYVLKEQFGKNLSSPGVNILDPCTGTGNFIVNILKRIPKRYLERVYKNQLFANEVMLMPYYIAGLNIEHTYYEERGEYEPFEGLCFVDTLDMSDSLQVGMEFVTKANTERVKRQGNAPITVIIGNPPYNVGQINENDNNKNRKYDKNNGVDIKIKKTYAHDSNATLKNKLYDPYVKFFRWATDRLKGKDGIVCFVSNSSFIDDITFDGMRKRLAEDFDLMYVLDLKGNIRKDSMRDGIPLGEKHTIFGLSAMVGISISIFVKSPGTNPRREIMYKDVPFRATRYEKFSFLQKASNIAGLDWHIIEPDEANNWIASRHAESFRKFVPLCIQGKKSSQESTLFILHSPGVNTSRDSWVHDFSKKKLTKKCERFIDNYNSEVLRLSKKKLPKNIDNLIENKPTFLKWSSTLKNQLRRERYATFDEDKITNSIYRPFCKTNIYYDDLLIDRPGQFKIYFPNISSKKENKVIGLSGIGSEKSFFNIVINNIPNYALTGFGTALQCFPFYIYNQDGSNRRENITDWALRQFQKQYKDKKITKWDIFYYVYALLHHPKYKTKYADCLRRERPRIPYAPDFRAFAKAGKELSKWHLEYETIEPYELKWIESDDIPLSYSVDKKMKLSKDKKSLEVNPSLILANIPEEIFNYRLGNRSALEWVIDQYHIKTDKRSGIVSDPNNSNDKEYIVRLIGQIIRVSLETTKIVNSLPKNFGG